VFDYLKTYYVSLRGNNNIPNNSTFNKSSGIETLHDLGKPPKQIGGSHYEMAIEPIEFIEANNLGFLEANVIKYISRYRNKNGLEDLKKARWYLDRLITNYKD